MAITYYYPEGALGPVCDIFVDDAADVDVAVDDGDGRQLTYGPIDWSTLEDQIGRPAPAIFTRRCRTRTLPDGTVEYYDCVDDLTAPIGTPLGYPLAEPVYDWPTKSTVPWGLDDDFEPISLSPIACSPHDPDINIVPQRFYKANGTFVEKVLVEKSTPVTFPVTSGGASVSNEIGAYFSEVGGVVKLVTSGTGSGVVQLKLKWNDNPNTYSTALGTVTINNVSLSQSGERGSVDATVGVTAGTDYTVGISGNSGGYSVGSTSICFYDLDGTDCNATLIIDSAQNDEPSSNDSGYWSAEGNTYAVWVNPEICTLPQQTQEVTYLIDIPAPDTYTFVAGADDTFQIFLNDNTTPLISGTGGIFAGGQYNTPYSSSASLPAGTLKMVVRCFNSDAGFNTDGEPSGLAFSWQRNPGGWYVKICKGGGCFSPSTSTWVKSGPNPDGGWSDWMDTYATFASNTETLNNQLQQNTWSINVPFAGDYILKYGFDDTGTISLDNTQIISSTYNAASAPASYTISNLSAGPHTLTATVTNTQPSTDWASNPAGVGWTLEPTDASSNVSVSFDSNGNIVTTGEGNAQVEFLFEWDDNPNTAGQALGIVTWDNTTGLEFTQTQGVSSGSDDDTVTLEGNNTYNIQVFNSTGGFEVQNNGQKICFFDNDGNDCNASVRIGDVTQGNSGIVANSTELKPTNSQGNLIWHTRMDTGYEFREE